MNTYYAYNVDTLYIVAESENEQELLDLYSDDIYGVTGSPAFGTVDGLRYEVAA